MDSYIRYLEDMLQLKEKEVDMYKGFIENELRCRIREEVYSEMKSYKNGVKEVFFKTIIIPQSKCVIETSNMIKK